jgi:hypothetical protein
MVRLAGPLAYAFSLLTLVGRPTGLAVQIISIFFVEEHHLSLTSSSQLPLPETFLVSLLKAIPNGTEPNANAVLKIRNHFRSFVFWCTSHPPTSLSTSDSLRDYLEVETLWSQIHHLEFQPISLKHVTRSQCISVDIRLIMGMEEPCFPAIENRLHTRWISEPEDTPSIPY